MQQWIDLNTKMTNDSLAALKQVNEINVKATETFFGQQKEMMDSEGATATSNVEKLTSVKDQQGFLDAQNEIFQSSITSALGNWKKMISLTNENYEAYRDLAEDTMQTTKSNVEQVASSVQQTAQKAN